MGEGDGEGLGASEGDGDGEGVGLGVGEGDGDGDGLGASEAWGLWLTAAEGLGDASGSSPLSPQERKMNTTATIISARIIMIAKGKPPPLFFFLCIAFLPVRRPIFLLARTAFFPALFYFCFLAYL